MKIRIKSILYSILVASLLFGVMTYAAATTTVEVYKSPTCGCCNQWVKHLESEGFTVKTKNMRDMKSIKKEMGVNPQYQSCHTATVDDYFIEGHVSAFDIKTLLKDKPKIKGVSVPGMPMGSPGMEGHRKDKYNVIAIDKNNNASVYSKH